MKKLIFTITCVVFAMTCLGQNIIQVSGNQGNSQKQDDCPFRINGICSTEDIGGVMVEFKYGESGNGYSSEGVYLHAENYNSFPVTVLLQISYEDRYNALDPQVVTCVLPPSGYKATRLRFADSTSGCILDGIIVRKLSN